MDLSLLSPQTLAAKAGAIAIYTLVIASGGFYGGCEFKQNQWDAEKFKQLEKAKKQEEQDKINGAKGLGKLEEGKKQDQQGADFVRQGITGKQPLLKMNCPPAAIVTGNEKSETPEVITQPGTIKNETSAIYLTAHFMQLYDVSVQPGNAELRARTYEETEGTTFDEGFEKVGIPNNLEAAAVRRQLNSLLDRIAEKKKLFQPTSGVF